jgi:hypothetical protein
MATNAVTHQLQQPKVVEMYLVMQILSLMVLGVARQMIIYGKGLMASITHAQVGIVYQHTPNGQQNKRLGVTGTILVLMLLRLNCQWVGSELLVLVQSPPIFAIGQVRLQIGV